MLKILVVARRHGVRRRAARRALGRGRRGRAAVGLVRVRIDVGRRPPARAARRCRSSRIGAVASSWACEHVAAACARRSSRPGRCPARCATRSVPAGRRDQAGTSSASSGERRHGAARSHAAQPRECAPTRWRRATISDHEEAEPGDARPRRRRAANGLSDWLMRDAAPREPAVRPRPSRPRARPEARRRAAAAQTSRTQRDGQHPRHPAVGERDQHRAAGDEERLEHRQGEPRHGPEVQRGPRHVLQVEREAEREADEQRRPRASADQADERERDPDEGERPQPASGKPRS